MNSFLYILFFTMFLLGCAGPNKEPVTVIRTVTKNVFIEVPGEFMISCSATAPPNAEDYELLEDIDKEYSLVMYSNKLLGDIAQCNTKINKLNKWNNEQKIIFNNSTKIIEDQK